MKLAVGLEGVREFSTGACNDPQAHVPEARHRSADHIADIDADVRVTCGPAAVSTERKFARSASLEARAYDDTGAIRVRGVGL